MGFCCPVSDLVARRRSYVLREVLNGLRWVVRTGATWRMMPHDLPPWYAISQQMLRWLVAECFDAIVHNLGLLLRGVKGCKGQPSAAILDSRTLQSTPDYGRSGWLRWSETMQGKQGPHCRGHPGTSAQPAGHSRQ